MPYPSQIDQAQIVDQARVLIEAEGADLLSLNQLAQALGVKAPSLYRYVSSKTDLLRAVNTGTVDLLFQALNEARASEQSSPQAQLMAVLQALRHFAHAHPQSYQLLFTAQVGVDRPDEAWLVEMVLPLQGLIAQLSGDTNALSALRGALALAHGFILLELNQQLQRGGDLGTAYTEALNIYLRGLRTN